MKKRETVIFIGPLPPPVNGHSLAFQYACEGFQGDKIVISQNLEGKSLAYKILYSFRTLWQYLFCFSRHRNSVIYIAGSRSVTGSLKDVLAIYMAGWFSCKVVLHIHAAYFDRFLDSLHPLFRIFYLSAYRRVNCFIALHECMLSEYGRFLSSARLEVVHNFYDPVLEMADPFSEKSIGMIRITYLSNLVYSKGILHLVDAFGQLKNKYPNIELYVAGAYQKDDHLSAAEMKQEFEQRLGGHPGIHYLGLVLGDQKAALLRSSHIFALPSFYSSEAMPISILEACRAGCAIVTTEHHYLSQLVDEKMGICVRPDSVEDLVSGLDKLLADPDLIAKLGRHNVEHSRDNFTLAAYQSKINSVLGQFSDKKFLRA